MRKSICCIALRTFLEKRYNQQYIKDRLGGDLGDRANSLKQYKTYEHKWKKELKSLKNKNKILYSIAK